ncbi:MAG TPA: DUF1840 domain-containing protein [Casimicrobiaceae bacterium]|nr:DUF1840 domain-containing protein [Casimicrobiaceae bacterium]
MWHIACIAEPTRHAGPGVYMLVTFKTKAHPDITMFGDVAVELLKLAGLSGTVPTAILAADAAGTLARLESALAHLNTADAGSASDRDPDEEPVVPLDRRALPLIALLRRAAEAGTDVMIEAR